MKIYIEVDQLAVELLLLLLLLILQLFLGPRTVSGTTRVSRFQKGKTRKVKPIWIYWSNR